jgi:FAD/FMN-containing dehydrogenase
MAEYNNVSCSFVTKQWTNTSFHALNLVSADYNDVACLPRTDAPCSLESYPRFVVSAESVSDVQKAVSFAREKHVRLIVKGTGHDAPGR